MHEMINMDANASEIAIRLLLAALAGAILGAERETHGRAAGLRTTIFVCMGAAVGAIVAQLMEKESASSLTIWGPEAGRLAQGLLAGIGFLGAGVIVREGTSVRGVTTASILWISTIIGLAIGSGLFFLGFGAVALVMAMQLSLPFLEPHIPKNHYATLTVEMNADAFDHPRLCELLEKNQVRIRSISSRTDVPAAVTTGIYRVEFKKADKLILPNRMRQQLAGLPGMRKVDWE